MKKYYEILEVSPNASNEVIERAYKVLVKKNHPDLYEGEKKLYAEQRVRDINEAYKILSDEFLREQYNLELQKEIQYNDSYQNPKYRNSKRRGILNNRNKNNGNDDKLKYEKSHVGTYRGVLDVTTTLFKNRPKLNLKELKREDYIAIGLTALIMIVLLVILWFIPATNGFIKSMLPFLD